MLDPRWKKVASDLLNNITRTILVVFSIFLGVFAVGMIAHSQAILASDLQAAYDKVRPSHASLSVGDEDSFDDELIQVIRNMREVEEAEGRRSTNVRVRVGSNDWRELEVNAIDDFDDIRIGTFQSLRGEWPPSDKTVLLERSGLRLLGVDIGDTIVVELPDGEQKQLTVSGVVHDLNQFPTAFSGTVYSYVTFDTIVWLGEPRSYNEIRIRVADNADSREHNIEVAKAVQDKIEKSGREVWFPYVPEPGEHPAHDLIQGIVFIMSALGVLSVFLSGFLVTNTISALLAQQVRQIGIMKAVGARSSQIMLMYMVLVVCFGIIALIAAIPLAYIATTAFTSYVASLINFDLTNLSLSPRIIALQTFVSIVVPVSAGIYPVIAGTRVTIREALSTEGGAGNYGASVIDRIVQRIRGFSRPTLLSLRNTFRRKGRVSMTLITLTLGGAIFISIFSVRDSLNLTVQDIFHTLFDYDVVLGFDRAYRDEYILEEAQRIPGVTWAESWSFTNVRRVYEDNNESENILVRAVPPDTKMINPNMVAGRWLLPEDENAIVISTGVLDKDPDIEVGDDIVLHLKGRDTTWRVVGVMPAIGSFRWAWVNYDYYGEAAREKGEASNVIVLTEQRTPEYQTRVQEAMSNHFKSLGIDVPFTEKSTAIRAQIGAQFNFIITSLLIMSVLIAVVGGLGLAGTMSLNVLERTREIGVMRAIGASDVSVLQIVIVEGIILGMLSWALGASLAFPISRGLSEVVGQTLFNISLSFQFSMEGLIIWLIMSIVLAAFASFLPAWNAAKLTVRDVLAYE